MEFPIDTLPGPVLTLLWVLSGALVLCVLLWFRQVRALRQKVQVLTLQLDREDHQAQHNQSRWVRRWRKAQARAKKARRWQRHLRLATREGGLYFFRLDVTTTRLRWYGPKGNTSPYSTSEGPIIEEGPHALPAALPSLLGDTGLPRQGSIDAFVQEHVHLEDRALIHGLLMQARHHGQLPATPLRLVNPDGRVFMARIWGRPGQGGKGRCQHVLGVLRLTQEG